MIRSALPSSCIALIGVIILAFVACVPPTDETSENAAIACAIMGLCFAAFGVVGMVRATLGRG